MNTKISYKIVTKIFRGGGVAASVGTISLLTNISPASALDFSFEFSDSGLTVTGSIFGLTDNATSTPTSVTSTSASLGFFDDEFITTAFNSPKLFTVVSGAITDAQFLASRNNTDGASDFLYLDSNRDLFTGEGPGPAIYELCKDFCNSGTTVAGDSIANNNTITFTALNSTAVPFEFSPGLGLLLIGSVWGIDRLRKNLTARQTIISN